MARVTIIIPCYNCRDFLAETLDSLCAQTYQDWACIIVDDRSEDDSHIIAQQYSAKDFRFRAVLRSGSLKGANVCRNQGLALATSEYVIFLDADDLLLNMCLEQRVADMNNSPDCGFGVYQTEMFFKQIGDRRVRWNVYTRTSDLHRFLSKDLVWCIAGPIWRRQVVTSIGGFDENLLSFHDWEIHMRALIAGIKYFKQPACDHFYRNGAQGISAISSVSCIRPDHFRSHEQMFLRTISRLKIAGLWDDEVRCRVGGLFWWLAILWFKIGCMGDADRVWRKAFEAGLFHRLHLFEGYLIFRLLRFRGGGRLSSLIQWSWPKHLCHTGSEYFLNAPMPDAEPLANGNLNRKPTSGAQVEIEKI